MISYTCHERLRSTDIRILGELEAEAEGRPLELGGRKQRAVLAALLLRAGDVVSDERLVDDVWGKSPPASAAHTSRRTSRDSDESSRRTA